MVYPPECIETERLYLKRYLDGDEKVFLTFIAENREHLRRFKVLEDWVTDIQTLEKATVYIKHMKAGWLLKNILAYAVWLKSNNQYIGETKLFHIDWNKKALEIGGFMAKKHEGNFYPKEIGNQLEQLVFEEMGFNKIIGICRKDNFISRFWAEKSKRNTKDYETNTHVFYSITLQNYLLYKNNTNI